MDDPQEAEFLTQIAAGTDPLTALAVVPDDKPGWHAPAANGKRRSDPMTPKWQGHAGLPPAGQPLAVPRRP